MDFIRQNLVDPVSKVLWNYVLLYVLLGAGLYFTWRTRFVQVRLFGAMLRSLRGSRSGAGEGEISSFQAFCVGLASRVGTGNIAGVAIALTLGGPGAIFWMWCVGLVGMATAFIEATLAQLFKVRASGGGFLGGPAYYIERGLRSRLGGVVFAVLLVITFGIAFNMVQANTISMLLEGSKTLDTHWSALILVVITAPVLFGGIRRVAKVAELVLPAMALVYIGLAIAIILMNAGSVGHVISQIVRSAFGADQALAGTAGGVSAALLNGAKRGLFSNEAGMGSAPNTAATATTSHPAKQGLIQSFGVFVDTMVVCTATALMVLLAGTSIYQPGKTTDSQGANLTQSAISHEIGSWMHWPVAVLVIVFAFSSVLGNYSYAEVNLDFLGAGKRMLIGFRLVVLAAVAVGSVLALNAVWDFADVTMALMALVNLAAIVLLGRWAFAVLADYDRQRRTGGDPTFSAGGAGLPGPLPTDAWDRPAVKVPTGVRLR